MKNKNHIESVRIGHVIDDSPDTSWLGKYTDTPSPEAFIRVGEHAGKQVKELGRDDELPTRTSEYLYFLPARTGNPDSPKQYFDRMEQLNNGEWSFIGIIAKAVVVSASGVTQTLRSGGLWGIESDSGKDYLASVEADELASLRAELGAFGFSARAISYAFRNVSHS